MSHSFRCALVSTGIFIFIKLATFFTHSEFTGIGAYSGLIALALTAIPLFFGIRYKRDHELGGYITIRQVMITGVVISLQASVMIAVYNFIHYSFIDKEVIAYWTEEAKRLGVSEKKSEAEIQAAIAMLTEFYSPFKQATVVLVGIIGTGTVLSFFLSSFLIRKPPVAEN